MLIFTNSIAGHISKNFISSQANNFPSLKFILIEIESQCWLKPHIFFHIEQKFRNFSKFYLNKIFSKFFDYYTTPKITLLIQDLPPATCLPIPKLFWHDFRIKITNFEKLSWRNLIKKGNVLLLLRYTATVICR